MGEGVSVATRVPFGTSGITSILLFSVQHDGIWMESTYENMARRRDTCTIRDRFDTCLIGATSPLFFLTFVPTLKYLALRTL